MSRHDRFGDRDDDDVPPLALVREQRDRDEKRLDDICH